MGRGPRGPGPRCRPRGQLGQARAARLSAPAPWDPWLVSRPLGFALGLSSLPWDTLAFLGVGGGGWRGCVCPQPEHYRMVGASEARTGTRARPQGLKVLLHRQSQARGAAPPHHPLRGFIRPSLTLKRDSGCEAGAPGPPGTGRSPAAPQGKGARPPDPDVPCRGQVRALRPHWDLELS